MNVDSFVAEVLEALKTEVEKAKPDSGRPKPHKQFLPVITLQIPEHVHQPLVEMSFYAIRSGELSRFIPTDRRRFTMKALELGLSPWELIYANDEQ